MEAHPVHPWHAEENFRQMGRAEDNDIRLGKRAVETVDHDRGNGDIGADGDPGKNEDLADFFFQFRTEGRLPPHLRVAGKQQLLIGIALLVQEAVYGAALLLPADKTEHSEQHQIAERDTAGAEIIAERFNNIFIQSRYCGPAQLNIFFQHGHLAQQINSAQIRIAVGCELTHEGAA